MPTWWIGAIPSKDDPVWKASSEKIPHMTILYLGDQNLELNETRIAEYIEHAASSLNRFGLSVDRRDVLGDDKADVLMFDPLYIPEDLREFRTNLLRDPEIKTAYDSSPQYSKWNPHLTLGYPDKPAKKIDDLSRWVEFDKIAFWVNDYAGWEFPLNAHNLLPEVSMSTDRELALEHFGVKGMKWGVRKSSDSGGMGRAARLATFQTDRAIKAHTNALTGKGGVGALAKIDKYTWGGGGRFEGYHNKKISQLERSKERIANGELVTSTILFGPRYSKLPKK